MAAATPLTEEQVITLCECFIRPLDAAGAPALAVFAATDNAGIDGFLGKAFPEADLDTVRQIRGIVVAEGSRVGEGGADVDVAEFLDLIAQRQYELVVAREEAEAAAAAAGAGGEASGGERTEMSYIESIAANLDAEQVDMLRDAFIRLDANGDGFVGRDELIAMMQRLLGPRFEAVWEYHQHIFVVADRDRDGRLSLTEFLSSFADGPGVVPREIVVELVARVRIRLTDDEIETLRANFEAIDKNKDGYIDRDELKTAIKGLLGHKYPKLTDANFDEMVTVVLATADSDSDGRLNLSEFIRSFQEDQGVLPSAFVDGRAMQVKRQLTKEEVAMLKDAFAELDANNDGFIDYSEMHQALTQTLGAVGIDPVSIQQMADVIMVTADRNRDGKLTLSEFIRNFKLNEDIMMAPVAAAALRRQEAAERLEGIVASGDLYKMVKLFNFLDADDDGFLSPEELQGILFQTLGDYFPEWTDDQKEAAIKTILAGADTDHDGKISINEFVASYCRGYDILPMDVVTSIADQLRRRLSKDEMAVVKASFQEMDKNNDGFVSREELKSGLRAALAGAIADDKELDEITNFVMSKVDSDKDGKISLKEFILSFELDQDVLPVVGSPTGVDDAVPGSASPIDEAAVAAAHDGEAPPARPRSPVATTMDSMASPTVPAPATFVATEPLGAPVAAPAPAALVPAAVATPAKRTAAPATEAHSPIVNDVSGVCINDAQLRVEFAKYDKNGNGFLSKSEFKDVYMSLEWLGLPPSAADFEKAWKRTCARDDKVSYDEFCLFMLQRSRM